MPTVEQYILESDQLNKELKLNENHKLLTTATTTDGIKDPNLLWRYARSYYLLSEEIKDNNNKSLELEYTDKALELATIAKDSLPNEPNTHKWFGIILGKKGDFSPTKEKISNAFIIRDSFQKAIDLFDKNNTTSNNKDPVIYYCMAKWCWSVMQVSWLERKAAALLFGTPPQSTYEDCEKYALASREIDSQQVLVDLLLGDVYSQ
eukprot:Tbor_TRINITY_DN5924_c3_g3::TRINITY_DN5924_c3_g3_i1::g.18923::m.18923